MRPEPIPQDPHGNVQIKLFIAATNAELEQALTEFLTTLHGHDVMVTLIEPTDTSALAGMLPVVGVARPADRVQSGPTVRIPLVDDETILERMRPETRRDVDLAQRRGVKPRTHPRQSPSFSVR